jgi:hypothetical protein
MEEKILRVMHRTEWVLVTIGALLMFLLAARYFFVDLDAAAADPDTTLLRELYLQRPVGLYIHAFAIMFPLIIGPVQFFLRRLTPEARRAKCLRTREKARAFNGREYVFHEVR